MKLNFKEFLVEQDSSSYGKIGLISEGLQGIKQLTWSGLDLLTAMQVIGYSPEWTPNMMFGEIRLKMLPHQVLAFQHVRQNIYSYLMKKAKPSVRPILNAGVSKNSGLKIDIAGGEGDDSQKNKYYSKYFGMLMKFLGQCDGRLRGAVKRDGGSILVTSDDETTAKNAFAAVDLFNSTADADRQNLTKDDYSKAVENFDAEKLKKNSVTAQNEETGTREFLGQGYFGDCLFMFAAVKAIQKFDDLVKKFQDICPNIKTPIDEYTPDGFKYLKEVVRPIVASIEEDFSLNDNWIDFLGKPDNSIIGRLRKLESIYGKYQKEFDETSNFDGEIPEKTRWLLAICNKMIQDGPKTEKNRQWLQQEILKLKAANRTAEQNKTLSGYVEQLEKLKSLPNIKSGRDLVQFLEKENIGFMINQYDNKQSIQRQRIKKMRDDAKKEKKPFDEKKAAADMLPNIMTTKSIADVKSLLNGFSMKDVDTQPNLTAPAAIRRVKLFQDAKARGADVFNTKNWYVAVLHTQFQSNVFGRKKPKVMPGTNTINAQLNRNDDEPGLARMTQKQIRERDGGGEFVKDNLGYDDFGSETGWCTNGGFSYHSGKSWNDNGVYSFSGYAKPVLIVLMHCGEGRLYQYGATSFLAERDDTRGYCASNSYGQGLTGFRRLLQGEKELHYAFTQHNIYRYLKNRIDLSDITQDSQSAYIQLARENGQLTPNGGLIITAKSDLVTYRSIFPIVTELIPANNSVACGMFSGADDYENLPPINCSKITSTCSMFENMQFASRGAPIILRQTSGVKLMRNMFRNSNPTAIIGLDTSSATDITNLMRDCKQVEFRPVDLQGQLDLKSCSAMDNAFRGCGAQAIDIVNTDNVKSAKDAFVDCFMLKSPPNAMFKRIQDGYQLVSDFNGNYEDVFAGCTEILDNFEKLDDVTAALRKFYEDDDRSNEVETDSRGFAVVHDRYDTRGLLPNMSKYPGIVLTKGTSSEYLFDELQNISIKTLDLNGIEKTDKMFYKCGIRRIGSIIGTKNVKSVNDMFQLSQLPAKLPLIELPALTGELTIFKDSKPSNDLPVIDVGPAFTRFESHEELPQPGMDANELNDKAKDICREMFGITYSEWLKRHADDGNSCIRPASRLYWNMLERANTKFLESLETDDRGYVIVTNENYVNMQKILDSNPKGLVFDKSVQSADVRSKLFSKIKMTKAIRLPPVDMSRITDASSMFSGANIDTLTLENTDNIVDGSKMFATAVIEKLNANMSFKSLKTADNMFRSCQIKTGVIDEKNNVVDTLTITTPVLEDANEMFHNFINNGNRGRFGIRMDTKSIKNAKSMFQYFSGGGVVPTEFPAATQCEYIFENAEIGVSDVGVFKFPQAVSLRNAFNSTSWAHHSAALLPAKFELSKSVTEADGMFNMTALTPPKNGFSVKAENVVNCSYMFCSLACADPIIVNNLDLPAATNIDSIFRNTTLKRIVRLNAPNVENAERAFQCTSLKSIFISNFLRSAARTHDMLAQTPVAQIFGTDGERLLARAQVAGR